MSLPINIDALLHGKTVEWERLELKAGWNPLAVLHTLCAFANDFHNFGGGYVVIGVAESDGQAVSPPKGIELAEIDHIQKELLNLGQSAIQPPYHPVVAPYEIEGRHILVLWAPGGQTRPYKARISLSKGDREYAYYLRRGSITVKARGDDERELMSLAATVPFDDRLNQKARVEDLDRGLIQDYLDEVESDLARTAPSMSLLDLGWQMNIVGGSPEAPFPLNVGLMFFSAEPWRFFPGMQIDVIWFPEGPGGDRFTEKVFKGPLHRITREALDYISRNYLNETVIKHPGRAESTRVANFPFEAIEEALVNAVYHRGYDQREPVEVRITRDDLVVLSYPGPDRSVRLDALQAGRALSRRYRNRRIGELLKELDLTEGRGTGIPKIKRVMERNGSPPPTFEFDEDHTHFMVTLPAHPDATSPVPTDDVTDEVPTRLEQGPDAHTQDAAASLTGEVTGEVAGEVERLLRVLERLEQAMSRTELQAALGLRHQDHFREAYLGPALAGDFIAMTIPDKPRSSKQRYQLTERGRAWLAADTPKTRRRS